MRPLQADQVSQDRHRLEGPPRSVWKDRPDNCPGFFEKWNIGLEMLYEWGEEATIYEAEDTKDANNILEDMLTILSGDGECGVHF